jgi:hypothetical protein
MPGGLCPSFSKWTTTNSLGSNTHGGRENNHSRRERIRPVTCLCMRRARYPRELAPLITRNGYEWSLRTNLNEDIRVLNPYIPRICNIVGIHGISSTNRNMKVTEDLLFQNMVTQILSFFRFKSFVLCRYTRLKKIFLAFSALHSTTYSHQAHREVSSRLPRS